MTRGVTDMLRDAAADLDRALLVVGAYRHDPVQVGRGFDLGFLAHSDIAALIQDVAALEAERDKLRKDNDDLRAALIATTSGIKSEVIVERKKRVRRAKRVCDPTLMETLQASVGTGEEKGQ